MNCESEQENFPIFKIGVKPISELEELVENKIGVKSLSELEESTEHKYSYSENDVKDETVMEQNEDFTNHNDDSALNKQCKIEQNIEDFLEVKMEVEDDGKTEEDSFVHFPSKDESITHFPSKEESIFPKIPKEGRKAWVGIPTGKKKSAVYEYFSVTEEGKYYVCQVPKDNERGMACEAKISAYSGGCTGTNIPSRTSNLKRHLKRHHPSILLIVNSKDEETKQLNESLALSNYRSPAAKKNVMYDGSSSLINHSAIRQSDMYDPISSVGQTAAYDQISSSQGDTWDPISLISQSDDSFGQSISSQQPGIRKPYVKKKVSVSMTADKFKKNIIGLVVNGAVSLSLFSAPAFLGLIGEMSEKLGVSLERNNIRSLILTEAKKQKYILRDLLCGRFLHLKIDACSYRKANYIAINVQFVDDKKEVVMRTLAVKNIQTQRTSKHLEKLVLNTLLEFGISTKNVLSVVKDNVTNMVYDLDKLNEDNEIESYDYEIQENYNDSLDEFLDSAVKLMSIQHMRCPLHVLHLAICEGLNETNSTNKLICKLRNIAKAARTPKVDAILKRYEGKGALLDQVTRWESTYSMIQRLIELKPVLTELENPDIVMSETEWEEVTRLEALLNHPYNVTKLMQSADLTPGLFYKEWKNIIFNLTKINCLFAEDIKDSMLLRESHLVENDMFLAAVFVDPMYRVILADDQQNSAKNTLCDLAFKINGFISEDVPFNISRKKDLDFESYLDEQERSKRRRLEQNGEQIKPDILAFKIQFYNMLKDVEKFDRSVKANVKEVINLYPLIVQHAALAVTALPAVQISAERMFSAVKIFKSELRTESEQDLLDDIVFLSTNSF